MRNYSQIQSKDFYTIWGINVLLGLHVRVILYIYLFIIKAFQLTVLIQWRRLYFNKEIVYM